MKIAIIPAFNEEINIGSLVLKTKNYVDKVIVVDDGSSDDTASIAKMAGAEVIRNPTNQGKYQAIKAGFKRAEELNADITITIDGDYSNDPQFIPKLIVPIEKENVDISMVSAESSFRAFSRKAIHTLVVDSDKTELPWTKFLNKEIEQKFRKADLSDVIKPRATPLGRYDEHVIDEVKKLTTQKEIYNIKRKIQKQLSKLESYRLICETFLKFIPPALLSFIISITILIPATKIINLSYLSIVSFIIITVVIFFICWGVLILLLDGIYKQSTLIEALQRRLDEVEKLPK